MTTTATTIARRFNRQFVETPQERRIHEVIDALCARARNLAPAFGEATMQAGATNQRPDEPRRALAWDCVQMAHHLNAFSDQPDLVALWFSREMSAEDLANEATLRASTLLWGS